MVSHISDDIDQSLVQTANFTYQCNFEDELNDLFKELNLQSRNARIKALSHRLAARRWSIIDEWISLPNTILSTVSCTSALASFDRTNYVTNISAIAVAILTSTYAFLRPKEKSITHLGFANEYNSLRGRIDELVFSESIKDSKTDKTRYHQRPYKVSKLKVDDLIQKLCKFHRKVIKEINSLDAEAPLPPRWATKAAVEVVDRKPGYLAGSVEKTMNGIKNIKRFILSSH